MSKFWESLGEKLADRWLQMSIPALVFWLGGFLSWLTRPGELTVLRDRGKQLADQPASTQALIIVGALMLVAASGVAVQVLTVPVQRLIEGYWPWPLRGLSRRLTD